MPYEARFSRHQGPKGYLPGRLLGWAGIGRARRASRASHRNLFAGAKSGQPHRGLRRAARAPTRFDLLVDWGWFHFITKPLFKLLHWLGLFFGNYGLAILATTVLVKLVFFPLANKSYELMAKMKKLQPEMEKLRERFKDDRAKQQQELMALYKNKKINPMAGCLPIVLQIPVFFALYKVLFITIDMRHAPFFGWIKDLSAPDPTSLFNLFGLLPYAVPEFLHVGVWPIIMGITMWVQMQLNPQQPDPMQQKIFNWMPVMFTFLLASFPVGSGDLLGLEQRAVAAAAVHDHAQERRRDSSVEEYGRGQAALRACDPDEGIDVGGAMARGGASLRRGAEVLGQRIGAGKKSDAAGDEGEASRQRPTCQASEMTREQALRTLGLEPGATDTEIDAAYKKHVRSERKPQRLREAEPGARDPARQGGLP